VEAGQFFPSIRAASGELNFGKAISKTNHLLEYSSCSLKRYPDNKYKRNKPNDEAEKCKHSDKVSLGRQGAQSLNNALHF
jgi:hypothetical protein